jgi:uncharacterized cupin superfamily protein
MGDGDGEMEMGIWRCEMGDVRWKMKDGEG